MADQQEPQDAAREELLRQIADTAKALEDFNAPSRATALQELAEAYAFVVSPSARH